MAVDLDDVVLGGHSMNASIVWSYLEQSGGHRLSKLIFIDQAPTVVRQPGFSDQDALDAGAVFTPDALYATASAVAINQTATLETLKGAFFSPGFIAANAHAVADNRDESLKMPAEYAARMLIDHCAQDWRGLLRHGAPTGLPVLVFGGALGTIVQPEAARWIAGQIPGAQLAIYGADEGGSHFMFAENPTRFNSDLASFIG